MRRLLPAGLAAIGPCLLLASTAWAQQPKEVGPSGFVTVLAGVSNTRSQFNTANENRRTGSLDDDGKSVTNAFPGALFGLRYRFASSPTELSFGTSRESLQEGGMPTPELGLTHELADGTRLGVSIGYDPGLSGNTWEDPFVTGERRKRTDVSGLRAEVRADSIAGSAIGLRYRLRTRDIDDEGSGNFQAAQPGSTLTPGDLDNLRRDSVEHSLVATYDLQLGERLSLRPSLTYALTDAEGGANSSQSLKPALVIRYNADRWDGSLTSSFGYSWYNRDNAIFDDRRNGYSAGVFALVGWKEPLGLEKWRLELMGGTGFGNADIDFYDSRSTFGAIGITRRF